MDYRQLETVEHIISGCQSLAADQYLNRHNQVAAQLHLDICKYNNIAVEAQHWYQHKHERVVENELATILWDSPVIADRYIPYNKPDLIVQEKQTNRHVIIDVAIPSDYNIQKKTTEKINKYTDLQIECQRMWNKKVKVVPVIIGATSKAMLPKSQDSTTSTSSKDQQSWAPHISLEKVLSIKPEYHLMIIFTSVGLPFMPLYFRDSGVL